MNRRALLATLGLGLTAGCSSRFSLDSEAGQAEALATDELSAAVSTPPPTPQSPPVEESPISDESTPIPEENVSVSVEASTETPSPVKLTDEEIYGLERLNSADQRFTAVVEAFIGRYGGEITDVTAASTDLVSSMYGIRIALAKAQKSYINAADSAANQDQRIQAQQMARCWQFLRHTVQTQLAVVEGYIELMQVFEAFEQDSYEVATEHTDNLVKTQRLAVRRHADLLHSATAQDMAAIESISESQYEAKINQLASDITVYAELDDALRDFIEGVRFLRQGKAWMYTEDRHVARAKDAAKDARTHLRSARKKLEAIRGTSGDSTTLDSTVLSLRTLAVEKTRESQTIIES